MQKRQSTRRQGEDTTLKCHEHAEIYLMNMIQSEQRKKGGKKEMVEEN